MRAYRHWTTAAEDRLIRLMRDHSIKDMAVIMDRTEMSILNRLKVLREDGRINVKSKVGSKL